VQAPVDVDDLIARHTSLARTLAWRHSKAAPWVLDPDMALSLAYEALVVSATRWEAYCQARNFDPGPEGQRYFAAYVSRRVNGAILDYHRSNDHVTRVVRSRGRLLRDADPDGTMPDAELAAAAGLDIGQVRHARAELARRPVPLVVDEVHDVPDLADVEGEAGLRDLLASAVGTMKSLPVLEQVVLALVHHQERSLEDVAEGLGLPLDEVTAAYESGVLAVHAALARASRE
jgi:DNA-directed RNA polymerase specialized sigma subunit